MGVNFTKCEIYGSTMLEIKVKQPNFSSSAIGVINFEILSIMFLNLYTFSAQFRKKCIFLRYQRICHNLNVMREFACSAFNPIMVYNYAFHFDCLFRWVGRQTLWWSRLKATHFSLLWPEHFRLLLGPPVFNWQFSFTVGLFDFPGIASYHATSCICRVLAFDSSWYFS